MEAASKYQLTANKSFPNSKPDGFRTIKKSGSTFSEPEEIHIEPIRERAVVHTQSFISERDHPSDIVVGAARQLHCLGW